MNTGSQTINILTWYPYTSSGAAPSSCRKNCPTDGDTSKAKESNKVLWDLSVQWNWLIL